MRNRRINQGIVAATVVVCAASGLGAPSNADDGGDDSLERAQRAEQRTASGVAATEVIKTISPPSPLHQNPALIPPQMTADEIREQHGESSQKNLL